MNSADNEIRSERFPNLEVGSLRINILLWIHLVTDVSAVNPYCLVNMEFIIYGDESVSKGIFYSDFFGGALVTSSDWNELNLSLDARKKELNLLGEIKWTKVSCAYLDKYKQMMELFFSYVKQNKIKVRIMFRETSQIPKNKQEDMIDNKYHLLYYQFIKHAFGLAYHETKPNEDVYLRLFFDQIADSERQNNSFRQHVGHLQKLWLFKKARIVIRPEDIVEIDSHKHPIQQCMDIVLGAMSFHLNRKHLEIPKGATVPGKKTQAKEELFNYIHSLIKKVNDSNFDISLTTLPDNAKSRWGMPYRHWKFISAEFREKNK